MRSLRLALCVLALVMGNMACAPKLLGPTTPSGYVFFFRTSDSIIWQEPVLPLPDASVPTFAYLTVQVRNAQGQPVDGVQVRFQVKPAWADAATVVPHTTTTQAGQARAVFRASQTGAVPIQVRVEDTTHQLTIAVSPPYATRESGAD